MKGFKYFVNTITCVTFAITKLETHTTSTALKSVLKKIVYTQDNTPPMPLLDAHLGGLFFLGL